MSKVLPQHFGKYILMRKIAMGGMAEIFKAVVAGAEGFEKDLVIKRILPHFTEDEAFVKMFIDEASITAKLQHPNIVQIFDFDVVDATYYIAMEYIEGRDLKDVLERSIKMGEPLSVAQCVWILMETAKGLHYAHTKEYRGKPLNIVHRDISPSNVMVSYNGEVKLMDFGIAKAAQRSTKTMAGAVKGKVAYMSPEQARGKQLDGRSDLFALGIMLWEMLTGKRLFLAESDFETLTNVLKADAPPPSSINPAVPADLDPIVLKCIEKSKDDRYRTVEEFGRELTRWYYSNVIDLEKEKLKPLMHRLFKVEMDELERHNEAERAGMGGGPLPSSAGDATAVMPAAGDMSPTSEQRTRMDVSAAGYTAPPAPPAPSMPPSEARTRAMPAAEMLPQQPPPQPAGTRTQQQQWPPPQPQAQKSRWPLIVLLLILLLGGGGAAAFVLLGQDSGPAKPDPTEAKATLRLTVDPPTAKITVDGAPSTGDVTGLALGSTVKVVAAAPDYERYEELIKLDEAEKILSITLKKKGKPHQVVLRPSDPDATVYVNGERLGKGPQSFSGMVGDELVVKVQPTGDGAEAVVKSIVLSEDQAIVDISVTTPAVLTITVTPVSAAVSSDLGTAEKREPGLWSVSGIEVGQTVELTTKAAGFRTDKQSVELTQANQTHTVELDKAALPKGKIRVWAKPWAQISVDGRAQGTTPRTIDNLKAGPHTVVLTKGSQKITKRIQVRPGKTVKVGHDFTK